MRYCPNCGSPCGENKQFCHNCGEKLSRPQSNTYTPQGQGYTAPSNEPVVSKKNAIIAFVFGLVNIELVLFCIFPYLCFFFFPACLVFSIIGMKKANKYVNEAGMSHPLAKIGKILCLVTLIVACVFFVLGMIFSFVPEAATAFYESFLESYGFDISDFSTDSGYNGDGSYGGGFYTIFRC
jgi:hypothetical protein